MLPNGCCREEYLVKDWRKMTVKLALLVIERLMQISPSPTPIHLMGLGGGVLAGPVEGTDPVVSLTKVNLTQFGLIGLAQYHCLEDSLSFDGVQTPDLVKYNPVSPVRKILGFLFLQIILIHLIWERGTRTRC